jgi:hypothetical protein
MSKIEVDAIEPQSGTTLTIGASGDTIIVPAGTVSLPAITTTGDTNTGIFFPAADTIAFTEGGTEAMRINSSGDVQIGSTNAGVGGDIDLSIGNTSSSGGITLWSTTTASHSIGFGDGYIGTDRYRGYLEYNHTGDSMRFATSATERMRIDSSGAMLLGTTTAGSASAGDLVVNGGVFLGGTATANELDDYEEGSFTAELSSTGATFTYSVRQGWYVKVGNRVMFNIYIQLDGTPFTTTANDTRITGLPFTSGNLSGNDNRMICGTRLVNFSSGQTFLMANIAANANTALLIEGGDNSAGVLLPSNALSNSSGQIFLSGSYQTA